MDECLDKNMVDKDEYPQTTEIESRCVHMLADLWNAPDTNTIGSEYEGVPHFGRPAQAGQHGYHRVGRGA